MLFVIAVNAAMITHTVSDPTFTCTPDEVFSKTYLKNRKEKEQEKVLQCSNHTPQSKENAEPIQARFCIRPIQTHSETEHIKVPLSKTSLSSSNILTWVALATSEAMTFSSENHEDRFAENTDYFTDKAWPDFVKALESSRILDGVIRGGLTLTTVPFEAPALEDEGLVSGWYQWRVSIPIISTYDFNNSNSRKTFTFKTDLTVTVVRSNEPEHILGIAINQWIAKEHQENRQ